MKIFNNANVRTPQQAVMEMIPYMQKQMRDHGTPMKSITRHMIGLFRDERGSRQWRRNLSEISNHPHADNPKIFLPQALEPMYG